jgi:uncharacterized membrane protein
MIKHILIGLVICLAPPSCATMDSATGVLDEATKELLRKAAKDLIAAQIDKIGANTEQQKEEAIEVIQDTLNDDAVIEEVTADTHSE